MLTNQPEIGTGIYSIAEVSRYLNLSYQNVHRWINEFWDKRLVNEWANSYSWGSKRDKAVNFYTLIEFYTFYQLRQCGLSTAKIVKAHKLLCDLIQSPYPFATSKLLTDGNKIHYYLKDKIVDVEEGFQFSIKDLIEPFCKKIEFGDDSLARRYFPRGKDIGVVLDPKRQFGQPIIDGTNIQAFSIYNMYKAGDSIKFLASVYELDIKKITDAIEFYKNVA